MKTFKEWMKNNYDFEELYAITEHGCISGVAGGLIYYTETCALYDKYTEEMHDALQDYRDNVGEFPEYVIEHLGSETGFKNAVVWFVAEVYAGELTSEVQP